MSVIVAASIIAIGIIVLVFRALSKRARLQRMHLRQVLSRFVQIGAMHQMRFSSQQILKEGAIGVDGRNSKILLLGGALQTLSSTHLLHFGDIKRCTVRKYYRRTKPRFGKKRMHETILSKIVLRFELYVGGHFVDVVFYSYEKDSIAEVGKLSRRAAAWQVILSKMISGASIKS